MKSIRLALSVLAVAAIAAAPSSARAQSLGLFQAQTDIGSVTPAGTAVYDAASKTYTITAAGENMWMKADAFHFVWRKATGDLAFTADIRFPHIGGNPHRKAALLFRQNLDPDAIYADAAVHGSGLTALQFREQKGDFTRDAELNIDLPTRIRVEKRGDHFTLFLAHAGEALHPAGMDITLHLEGEYYLGLGVCSHDKNVSETAVFSNVSVERLPPVASTAKFTLHSTLQSISIEPEFRRSIVAYTADSYFEAPNWSHDGKDLIFDMGGRLMQVPVESSTPQAPQPIETGNAIHCNGSHGLSPDGTLLAVTCETVAAPGARIYIVPSSGGTPRLLTENPQSYFHSWSPDGKTIAFIRPGNGLNIVTIPVAGGRETALTTTPGINDDSDYSANGRYIYFNSDRGIPSLDHGTIQLWRMDADGNNPQQITYDERNNWTPHPSPDGKWIAYLSFGHDVTTHASNKEIEIRLLNLTDGTVTTLVKLVGGSGTMNVPSWSPDSKHLAFVSYELIPAAN